MPKRHHAEVRGGTLRCRFTSPAAAGFPWRMHGRASRVLIDIDGSAELRPTAAEFPWGAAPSAP